MSSNLGRTNCYYCDARVRLTGEYDLDVDYTAHAECTRCGAQYNAWVRNPIKDLQFRSAQNDEPDPEDLPIWKLDDRGFVLRAVTDDEIKQEGYFGWKYRDEDSDYGRFLKASQDRWFARRDREKA